MFINSYSFFLTFILNVLKKLKADLFIYKNLDYLNKKNN